MRDAQHEHEAEFSSHRAIAEVEAHADADVSAGGADDENRLPERIDPVTQAVETYYALTEAPDATPALRSRLVTLFAASQDARHASVHACLVRGTAGAPAARRQWQRLVLDLIEKVDTEFAILPSVLGGVGEASEADVRWEIADLRIAAIQEYGWHLASEELKYPLSSELEACAVEQNWNGFIAKLKESKGCWVDTIKDRWVDATKGQRLRDDFTALNQEPAALWSPRDRRFEGLRDRSVREGTLNRFRSTPH